MTLSQTRNDRLNATAESLRQPDWTQAVADAIRAPSSHNSQPWRFVVDGDNLIVEADFTRALPVVDPHNRELFISCGAALEQLLLSIRTQGFGYRCRTDDDPQSSTIARVSVTGRKRPDPEDERLHAVIGERHTCRVPFEKMPLPKALQSHLRCAAARRDSSLVIVDEQFLNNRLVELTMQGDRLQSEDPEFRRELARWMRPNHSDADDGMRGESFGLNDFPAYFAPLVIRTFDRGDSIAARDEELLKASGMLAVLCTVDDGKYDWITAGRALARLALTATAGNYALSFLNQAVEVASLRRQLLEHLGEHRIPQLVLRFGRSRSVPATPRRPIPEVLSQR